VTAEYLIYLPKDYDARSKTRWPLMLFLHGAGERGTNLMKVAVHGPPKTREARQGLSVSSSSRRKCPANQSWDTTCCWPLLDEVEEKYNVDKGRVYLTGLSMAATAPGASA